MGLDFSHGGARWAYRGFGSFREQVCQLAGLGEIHEYQGFGGDKEWNVGHPLTPFLNHSDCDGEIGPIDCMTVAPHLLALVVRLPDEYDRRMGLRLVAGMLLAAADGEPLEFT